MYWDYFTDWEAAMVERDWDPARNERHFGSVLVYVFNCKLFWRVLRRTAVVKRCASTEKMNHAWPS